MNEKNRQTAAIILVDLNPEHLHRCFEWALKNSVQKLHHINETISYINDSP